MQTENDDAPAVTEASENTTQENRSTEETDASGPRIPHDGMTIEETLALDLSMSEDEVEHQRAKADKLAKENAALRKKVDELEPRMGTATPGLSPELSPEFLAGEVEYLSKVAADAVRRQVNAEKALEDHERELARTKRDADELAEKLAKTGGYVPPRRLGTRQQIEIKPGTERAMVNAAEEALAEMGGVYVRGRSLVAIVYDKGAPDWLTRPAGSPVIVRIADERLRELLGQAADWVSYDKKSKAWKPAMVPAWLVSMLVEREEWHLPQLEGVVECPVLRHDGTILDNRGYDHETRLFYDPGQTEFPAVKSSPTKEQALDAMVELLEPFDNFPFVAESDGAAFVALVLSMIGRGAVDGCVPLFLSTAPTPGSGKGLLVDGAAIIATGRTAPKMAPTDNEEETRKRLLSLALENPVLVVIDNVEGEIGSPALAMALTSGVIQDRALGVSKMVTATLRPVWCATGNNVRLKGDMGRRVIPIGLDPKVEHPEDRTGFAHPDLLAYLREHRPRLVVAALTILRGYFAAGCPAHGKPAKGSFEKWDAVVRGAILWVVGHDPLGGVARIREAGDTDRDKLRDLLASWRDVFGDKAVTVAEAVTVATGFGEDVPAAARDALRQALTEYDDKVTPKKLGYAVRGIVGRIAGELVLRSGTRTKRGQTYSVAPPGGDDGGDGDDAASPKL